MANKVYIMRGTSGSGKSTYARTRWPNAEIVSADFYFMKGDKYEFDATKLREAHAQALRQFISLVQDGYFLVVVDNTNTTVAEMAPYVAVANAFDYEVEIINLEVPVEVAAARNVHGCTKEVVERQLANIRRNTSSIPKWWKQTTIQTGQEAA